jgi:internalin A
MIEKILELIEIERKKQSGRLRISEINFENLPAEICELTHLRSIFIENNKHSFTLPANLKKLLVLKEFHIHQTGLTEIPKEIFEIKNLENLCLGGNKIGSIPNEIQKLKKLKRINLSNNKFKNFPKSLITVSSLKEVRLSNNLLTTLPKETLQFAKDIQIDLQRNKIPVPREALTGLSSDVIQYILDFQETSDKKPLREAKLIFIGSGDVGKTSLIKRITQNTFNANECKTDGIEITDWTVKKNKDDINVHIWDFGGQEIMHTTHKFFMTSRSVYVLVINPRTQDSYGGDNELEYWLKLIRSFAGEVPIIIAINKCEVHKTNIAKGQILDKYSNVIDFVETSSLENIGIESLKELISKAITGLQFINDKLPKSYFDIKTQLQKQNKDYIGYLEFERICKKIDPDFKETSQFALVRLLHDLGIMLSFNEDRNLKETQVLNPDWVTKGVYQIINYSKLIDTRGILNKTDLPIILDSKKYPTDKERLYIADLMEHFELSFKSENNKDLYFIPSAFSKDKPENFEWNYPSSSLLRFQYSYDILPSSIMSRFIVKTHRLIRNSDFWYSGVVIKLDNCEALITKDAEERVIKIEVGGIGDKRGCLSVIRERFEDIHQSYKDIDLKRYLMADVDGKIPINYNHLIAYEKANEEYIFIPELASKFNVKSLLFGIEETKEFNEELKKEKEHTMQGVTMFISYSHKDEALKEKLVSHLGSLKRDGTIRTWDDRMITGGKEWNEEIMNFLTTSEIIVLLISADFISSDFCYSKELDIAMKRHNNKDAVVIPIFLRACDFKNLSFGRLQGFPKGDNPITSWENQDEAFTDIAKGIRKSIDEYLTRK